MDNYSTKIRNTLLLFKNIDNSKQFLSISKNWDKNDVEINARDSNKHFLIHLAVGRNNIAIIERIVKLGARLDVLDTDGTSILAYPIRQNLSEMVKSLININKKLIGSNILNILDIENRTPLMYCVDNNRFELFDLLVSNGSDIGNILLYSIEQENESMALKSMELDGIDINRQDELGWTALNLSIRYFLNDTALALIGKGADPNIVEYRYNTCPMYEAIRLSNRVLINALLEMPNIDVNIQYYDGDSLVAKATYDGLWEEVELMLKTADVNIYNTYSQTVFALLITRAPKELIKMAKNPDYNIQDNYGMTPLHYLIDAFDDSIEYFNLSAQLIDINIKDLNGDSPLSLITNKNYLIQEAKKAYLDELRKYPNVWEYDWQNKCSLTDKCPRLDKEILINSIPNRANRVKIILNEDEAVEYGTFVGSVIDIFSGLIYLQRNKKVTTSLPWLDSSENDVNIIWDNMRIHYPPELEEMKKFSTRFLIIPLIIISGQNNHANIVIFDAIRKTIERFEPYGYSSFTNIYNPDLLDDLLENELMINGYTYLRPKDYQNSVSFQDFDSYENNSYIGDPDGYCALWSIWYPYYRTSVELSAKELNKELVITIRSSLSKFRTIIRNFSKNITDIRDEALQRHNLTINSYMNNPDQIKLDKLFSHYK